MSFRVIRSSSFAALSSVGLAVLLASACGDEVRSSEAGEAGTGETGDTGELTDDAACSVRLTWTPGVGDISSFPTMEMVEADASRASGYRVVLDAERFAGLNDYGQYTSQIEAAALALDGFGTSADVFVGFDAPLSSVPGPSPAATPSDLGGFVVMPAQGEPYLVPAEFGLTDEGATVLAHPLFPLPPATDVALYLKTTIGAAAGDCVGASDGMRDLLRDPSGDDTGKIAAAIDALVSTGAIASSEELAVLHPYPVGSVTRESDAVAQYIAGLPDSDFALANHECATLTSFEFCTSTFAAANFRNADGQIEVDVDAVSPTAAWDIKMYSWLPLTNDGPWPTLLYGHGLTGDGEQGEFLAEWAVPAGMAVVSIDAVKHGEHPSLEGQSLAGLAALLEFFAADVAAGNIDALELRDNFRQSTYDKLYAVRVLQAGADLNGDGNADVDATRLAYHGTSLGAIMGVELMTLTDAFLGGALVMPGARLTSVMTDPMGSFDDVLAVLIPSGFTDGDTRRLFSMVQAVLDTADPASYGPKLLGERNAFAPNKPDLVMGAVLGDTTVPNSSNWTAARALGLDIVPPTLAPVVGMDETPAAPVSANLDGTYTAGMLQFDVIETGEVATHTNMAFSDLGLTAWIAFHRALFEDGRGVIIDPYAELGVDHP